MTLLQSFTFILSFTTSFAWGNLKCRPEGPVLPRPTALAESAIFKEAAANLTDTLDAAVSGSITAGWPVKNVSFSLAVISADQDKPGVPIWEYHHLASANENGTKDLDRDSQYLIGSVSKVIASYVLLKSGVDLDAPVTKYLPKLGDKRSTIQWRDVSLRMLASHLSGAPANYGFSEFYVLKEVFLSIGFPLVEDSDYPPCGVTGLNKGCSRQDYLTGMTTSYPQTTPNERPAYSNMAFVILGMALEEYTGKNFTQLVKDIVSNPLDLKHTYPSPGDSEKAVIPPGESSWGADYKENTPSIQIDAWLKPVAFAGNEYTMTGMPWEILRSSKLTPDHPHTVTIYGKSGGAQNYRSQLDFVDEYGFAVVLLTAGPMKAAPILRDAMLATFVAAADAVSREQAEKYEQKFRHKGGKGQVPVEASLKQDKDSMVLASLRRNNTDILAGLAKIWTFSLGDFLPTVGPKIRVFPSGLRETTTLDGKPVTKEVWHLWPDIGSDFKTDLPGNMIEDMNCVGWTIQDWVHYGGEPLDRVVVYVGEDGDVEGFEVPFLRSGVSYPS
ncbi:hypothetical protein LRP88_14437 [Fusarium phalaenopsidis]